VAYRQGIAHDVVTLLTDFGTADSYVAEMKGVLLTCAPSDTGRCHPSGVAGDVRGAQYVLSRTWMFFPEVASTSRSLMPVLDRPARARRDEVLVTTSWLRTTACSRSCR